MNEFKLQKKANQDDVNAMYDLGYNYFEGNCVDIDYNQARECYKKALILDDDHEEANSARYNLGLIYFYGYVGIKPDFKKALDYFEAVEEVANYQLGLIYFYGYGGIKPDFKKARDYFEAVEGVEVEEVDANYHLGLICYLGGKGVTKKPIKAFKLFEEVEEKQGNFEAEAQYHLGLMCHNGEGQPNRKPDLEEAYRWLKKAAVQGHKEASNLLNKIDDQW